MVPADVIASGTSRNSSRPAVTQTHVRAARASPRSCPARGRIGLRRGRMLAPQARLREPQRPVDILLGSGVFDEQVTSEAGDRAPTVLDQARHVGRSWVTAFSDNLVVLPAGRGEYPAQRARRRRPAVTPEGLRIRPGVGDTGGVDARELDTPSTPATTRSSTPPGAVRSGFTCTATMAQRVPSAPSTRSPPASAGPRLPST